MRSKVTDKDLYEETDKDPKAQFYEEMIDLWRYGKSSSFVTPKEAKQIVGLTDLDNKSTASRLKSGKTYLVSSLKIHKLDP